MERILVDSSTYGACDFGSSARCSWRWQFYSFDGGVGGGEAALTTDGDWYSSSCTYDAVIATTTFPSPESDISITWISGFGLY
jgi:hypothetical protein